MKIKNIIFTLTAFFLLALSNSAQEKYLTKTGKIKFFSKAPLENITADNEYVTSLIDLNTGDMGIAMFMKAFKFKKALMEEHFNENYIESERYPKASFKGKILNFENISDIKKEFIVKGQLTIHGVSNDVEIKANFKKLKNTIEVDGNFSIALEDYKIKIPKVVFMNIAENIKITFNLNHLPYKR
jgi:polyisoprenoid-binding protein YceI